MQRKLVVLFLLVLLAFVALSYRLFLINRDKGADYKRQVMRQQAASSRVLPFKRGDILDRKGSKLAYSEKVYNLVIDAKMILSEEGKHLEPTLKAISQCFPEVNTMEIRDYINKNPASRYKVFAKKLDFNEIEPFKELQKAGLPDETASGNDAEPEMLNGVWFEEDYERKYPGNTLACDVIGFVQGNNTGFFGMEEFYNDVLNGTDGREYGYMNEDYVMEDSIKPAVDGYTIVSTLDSNIQSIVEKNIAKFMSTYKDAYRIGAAAENIGVLVMNPNNGEIYAMAGYPFFDLNDPTNMEGVDLTQFMPASVSGNEAQQEEAPEDESVSENEVKEETDPEMLARNKIWRNFCISDSYEPGSVMKPFTVAGALDAGKITGNEAYQCNGYLEVGGYQIHCHNRLGDGLLTVQQGIAKSCNVVLMDIAFATGKEEWLRYNRIFNFGYKTNIDLSGETNASELTFNESMGLTDLAVASFGQGFNVTMIQMAAGFSALVNGGYYYQPRVVSEIRNAEGAVVEEHSPRLYKQVISESTSERMREYLKTVVMSDPSECTGWSARPAGYTEGGKTGTAEKAPRTKNNYLISFMGYVPADDPEVLCYVVIDTPNAEVQSESTRLATRLNRDIMTEVLPYLNIFPTEPISEEEAAELKEKQDEFSENSSFYGISVNMLPEGAENAEGAEGEGAAEDGEEAPQGDDDVIVIPEEEVEPPKDSAGNPIVNNEIQYDPETGYPLDPGTGEVLDPVTLQPLNPGGGNEYNPEIDSEEHDA
ncbi:MAG: cell division protein FtsI [Lachnospiraceae bacterium]|nr:cell division protein FtsI [Lachnospiraceae bacterium]